MFYYNIIKINFIWLFQVGSGSGKTSVIKTLAQLYGHELRILSVNAAMDTIEILGGFEQVNLIIYISFNLKKLTINLI